MEDFYKPKIVYPETTQGAYFAYDDTGIMIDKTCFMLISDNAEYLQHILSSKIYEFAYKNIYSSVELGEHGYQYNKHAFVKLPVPKIEVHHLEELTDKEICNFFSLTSEEVAYVETHTI